MEAILSPKAGCEMYRDTTVLGVKLSLGEPTIYYVAISISISSIN